MLARLFRAQASADYFDTFFFFVPARFFLGNFGGREGERGCVR